MGIPINNKDIDDWNARDFALFVKQKLLDRGIHYQIKYPHDIIALSAILKVYRRQDKSKFALVKYINDIFATSDLTNVQNLSFIRTLVLSDYEGTSFAKKKRDKKAKTLKNQKPNHEPPQMGTFTAMWLQSLRTGV